MKTILILDLDGVLITNPSWKADEIDLDNYSKFNPLCIEKLNILLNLYDFDIWLISTRRTVKTLKEFNEIFKNRNINKEISGFVPQHNEIKSRKEEVLLFIESQQLKNYIIIDDDKTLNGLSKEIKLNLIQTELMRGFNDEKLSEAKIIMEKKKVHNTV